MSGSGGVWLITQVANEKSKNAKVKMQKLKCKIAKRKRVGPARPVLVFTFEFLLFEL
jgi:hypothetical protein